MDPKTLPLLCDEKSFKIVGVVLLTELFHTSLNPINWLYQLAYYFKYKKISLLPNIFYRLWTVLKSFGSITYSRYDEYLGLLLKNNITIVSDEDDQLESIVKENKIDLILINGWSILKSSLLELPKFGSINIHPSELPKYRGALPTLWSLKNHDSYSALSYICPDSSTDGGKILSQYRFDIDASDDALSIENKIFNIISRTLIKDLILYLTSVKKTTPQTSTIEPSKTGRYTEYLKIDFGQENAYDIFNKVILYPYLEPFLYCYTFIDKKKITIKNLRLLDDNHRMNLKSSSYKR